MWEEHFPIPFPCRCRHRWPDKLFVFLMFNYTETYTKHCWASADGKKSLRYRRVVVVADVVVLVGDGGLVRVLVVVRLGDAPAGMHPAPPRGPRRTRAAPVAAVTCESATSSRRAVCVKGKQRRVDSGDRADGDHSEACPWTPTRCNGGNRPNVEWKEQDGSCGGTRGTPRKISSAERSTCTCCTTKIVHSRLDCAQQSAPVPDCAVLHKEIVGIRC